MSNKTCKQTEYPSIYENTYWGNFQCKTEPEIIENRNKFIPDYDIKKTCRTPKYVDKQVDIEGSDHMEYYLNGSGQFVTIMSPYTNEKIYNHFLSNGWAEIYPLYNTGYKTFIKIINPRMKASKLSIIH